MSIVNKIKYTAESIEDIVDALESHGYNMKNYVLGDYGNLIRQLDKGSKEEGVTGFKSIPITVKLIEPKYNLDTISVVTIDEYRFMEEDINRRYLYNINTIDIISNISSVTVLDISDISLIEDENNE